MLLGMELNCLAKRPGIIPSEIIIGEIERNKVRAIGIDTEIEFMEVIHLTTLPAYHYRTRIGKREFNNLGFDHRNSSDT